MDFLSRLLPEKVIDFFRRSFQMKYLPPVLCLLLSALFWLMLSLNETVTREFTMPIKVINVPSQYGLISDNNFTVTLSMTDQAMTLIRRKSDLLSHVTTLSLADYIKKSDVDQSYIRITDNDLATIFKNKFGKDLRINEIKPKETKIYFTATKPFKVPIHLVKPKISTNDYLVDVKLSHDSVTVYAIHDAAQDIKSVEIRDFVLDEREEGKSKVVHMPSTAGVRYEPSSVKVEVITDMLTSDSMYVDIAPITLADGRKVLYIPPKVMVSYTVLMKDKEKVKKNGFTIVPNPDFNYLTAKADSVTLRLSNPPSSIVNVDLKNRKVAFVIQSSKNSAKQSK